MRKLGENTGFPKCPQALESWAFDDITICYGTLQSADTLELLSGRSDVRIVSWVPQESFDDASAVKALFSLFRGTKMRKKILAESPKMKANTCNISGFMLICLEYVFIGLMCDKQHWKYL